MRHGETKIVLPQNAGCYHIALVRRLMSAITSASFCGQLRVRSSLISNCEAVPRSKLNSQKVAVLRSQSCSDKNLSVSFQLRSSYVNLGKSPKIPNELRKTPDSTNVSHPWVYQVARSRLVLPLSASAVGGTPFTPCSTRIFGDKRMPPKSSLSSTVARNHGWTALLKTEWLVVRSCFGWSLTVLAGYNPRLLLEKYAN